MSLTTNDSALELVTLTLNEFEDRPLDVSLRRSIRIATLLGDTYASVRYMLELKPIKGSKSGNADDIRKLMSDPSQWDARDSAHQKAISEYIADRLDERQQIHTQTIPELERLITMFDSAIEGANLEFQSTAQELRYLFQRIKSRLFVSLCAWERQLNFSNVNEQIFLRFKTATDTILSKNAPDLIDQFNAIYRRLRDGKLATSDLSEELSQAVTTCRRILKKVVDHAYPSTSDISEEGTTLNDQTYKNRLKEFIKEKVSSGTARAAVNADIDGLYSRFAKLDALTSKAVHATIALEEAESCAINTYILAGEILRLVQKDEPKESAA